MTTQLHRVSRSKTHPYCATWIVNAPWAHPDWNAWAILLIDLTSRIEGLPPATLHAAGVTHEVQVYALRPDRPVPDISTVAGRKAAGQLLMQPMEHGYQFRAAHDAAAEARIRAVVADIERRRLYPDTDFRASWDRAFPDAISLRLGPRPTLH